MLTVSAPAKINLVLEILGRGRTHHDICSIVQTIDLCDTLTLEPAGDIRFSCSEPALSEDNLVVRAALLLRETYGVKAGARIHLEKRIPSAQGLGGGSSDAASTLCALNSMWALGLGAIPLGELGATLGSDVPLFLTGGTMLMEGRGERVTPLPDIEPSHLVLFTPAVQSPPDKTAVMYRQINPEMYTRGQFVRAAAFALERSGSIPEDLMFNVFEKVTASVFPGLPHARAVLEETSGKRGHLAGSGPCMYVMFDSEAEARRVVFHLEVLGRRAFYARTSGRAGAAANPCDSLRAGPDA